MYRVDENVLGNKLEKIPCACVSKWTKSNRWKRHEKMRRRKTKKIERAENKSNDQMCKTNPINSRDDANYLWAKHSYPVCSCLEKRTEKVTLRGTYILFRNVSSLSLLSAFCSLLTLFCLLFWFLHSRLCVIRFETFSVRPFSVFIASLLSLITFCARWVYLCEKTRSLCCRVVDALPFSSSLLASNAIVRHKQLLSVYLCYFYFLSYRRVRLSGRINLDSDKCVKIDMIRNPRKTNRMRLYVSCCLEIYWL